MSINERIKKLRKKSNLTLKQFGEKLGVSDAAISRIENGNRSVTEQMIKSICREFNISYLWLTEGIEPMDAQPDSLSMARIDALMTGENEFAKNLFKEFANLDKSEWELLEKIIKNISKQL
ncbi:MAG: helix-turn-helix transcriptional regulator [Lachnospiraceae bacterium]|nr:helix-turn-helix transcriptional regulator [Lachnospiraceae bacterium]